MQAKQDTITKQKLQPQNTYVNTKKKTLKFIFKNRRSWLRQNVKWYQVP